MGWGGEGVKGEKLRRKRGLIERLIETTKEEIEERKEGEREGKGERENRI